MHVLITGVAGFIGSSLAEHRLGHGDSVTGVDNLSDYYDIDLKGKGSSGTRVGKLRK